METHCAACGKPITVDLPVGRRDECRHCAGDLHACIQCASFDARGGICREPHAEPQRDRQAANACEWFRFAGSKVAGAAGPSKEELRAAAEALFRKKP